MAKRVLIKHISSCTECPRMKLGKRRGKVAWLCHAAEEAGAIISDRKKIHPKCPLPEVE